MAKCTFSSPLILTVVTTFTTCLQSRTLSVTASNHCLRSEDLQAYLLLYKHGTKLSIYLFVALSVFLRMVQMSSAEQFYTDA